MHTSSICLSTLLRELQKAWSQSTPMDSATTHIYAKAGFQRTGEYVILKKELA